MKYNTELNLFESRSVLFEISRLSNDKRPIMIVCDSNDIFYPDLILLYLSMRHPTGQIIGVACQDIRTEINYNFILDLIDLDPHPVNSYHLENNYIRTTRSTDMYIKNIFLHKRVIDSSVKESNRGISLQDI